MFNIFKNNPLKLIEKTHQLIIDLPSTTQLINLLMPFDYSVIKTEYLEMAQIRGTCVHKQIEEYILFGKEAKCDHDIKTHLVQGEKGIAFYQSKIEEIEKEYGSMEKFPEISLFSNEFRGSIDLLLMNDKYVFIIDWKTTSKINHEKENLQTYMYSKLVSFWINNPKVIKRFTFNTNKNKLTEYDDFSIVENQYQQCLNLYKFS